jgi:hypothetical protein
VSWTRRTLLLAVSFLTAAAPSPGTAEDRTSALSKLGYMQFVAGRLTEPATPSPPKHSLELSHGYELLEPLVTFAAGADVDEFRYSAKPFSSYEAVVDATSGDIGPTLSVTRVFAGTTTALQSSVPVGVGFSRSIRWMNTTNAAINNEAIRVVSGQCTTNCGPDDVYMIRGYETTYSIPRFNNAGTQITVLLLQNPNDYVIHANVYFWSTSGVQIGFQAFVLGPKQVVVFNTATVAPSVGGSVTIAHDGRYGDLAAKTVALEPSTGFSFDSPALPRPLR